MTTAAIAPTNIAVLKYWGMEPGGESLCLPTKTSISFTVEGLATTTVVEARREGGGGRLRLALRLNGAERPEGTKEHSRVSDFLRAVGGFFPSVLEHGYTVVSENNFPTAAGFASSASGFAALAKALSGEIPEIGELDGRRLSAVARLGSGSAARSIPEAGGLVEWRTGGMWESVAESILPPDFWRELRIIYATVDASEKRVKSSAGMQMSVRTNPLYRDWVRHDEDALRPALLDSIRRKDFEAFADLAMRASNGFHQICMGTRPPLRYMSDRSHAIVKAVQRLNAGGAKAAYTFDAGPNAIVFTLERHGQEVSSCLRELAADVRVTRPGRGASFLRTHSS